MRDRDSERDPWEYRKVVDLEWSTRKSYGNKKGWLAVCELLESYHRADVQSAAEDGDQNTCHVIRTPFRKSTRACNSHPRLAAWQADKLAS